MHPDKAIDPLGRGHHLGDDQRRRIARKNRRRLDDLVDGRVGLAFDIQVLGYRLDDDVAVGKVFELRRAMQPAIVCARSSALSVPFSTKWPSDLSMPAMPFFRNSSATSLTIVGITGSRCNLRDA